MQGDKKTAEYSCAVFVGSGREEDLLAGYAVGADDYIVKPFPLSVLSQKCMAMIRRSKKSRSGTQTDGKGNRDRYDP